MDRLKTDLRQGSHPQAWHHSRWTIMDFQHFFSGTAEKGNRILKLRRLNPNAPPRREHIPIKMNELPVSSIIPQSGLPAA
jgi:hypothetical protein